ncbi:MAG TPA: DUF2314 domain-containing protein [Patescibacteria group bacterium]|nr:DUF2314 domain-containing protein [Patescibacteria group bacterium]
MPRLPLLFFCLVLFAGCGRPDKTINIADDDPEMLAAIAKARDTLPQFWNRYEKHDQGETDFALKVKISDKSQTEYFWVSELERKNGELFGTINNDPELVHNVKLGQRLKIPAEDIADWLYLKQGKIVGNYTLRVLFKKMAPDEVEKNKRLLADP